MRLCQHCCHRYHAQAAAAHCCQDRCWLHQHPLKDLSHCHHLRPLHFQQLLPPPLLLLCQLAAETKEVSLMRPWAALQGLQRLRAVRSHHKQQCQVPWVYCPVLLLLLLLLQGLPLLLLLLLGLCGWGW